VSGDAPLLRLAFMNLLSNAVKYTRGREPAIVRIYEEAGAPPGMAAIAVADNGAGFDMAAAGALFGIFQRLHRDDEFEGIGVGLANVKRIVERHAGSIHARGRVGEGATFVVVLPRTADVAVSINH
jgi:hypothetical protein